jgi:hypothetical protein
MHKEQEPNALEVQQQHDETNQSIEAPVDFLVAAGVDPSWAKEYVDFEQKYDHFSSSLMIWWNVSPRFIMLAVKRPESLIRLIKAKWERSADKRPGDTNEKNGRYDLAKWYAPSNMTWHVDHLEQPIDLFKKGLNPMEALIEIHSDCENGQEDDPVYIGSPDLMWLIIGMSILMISVVFAITYSNHASQVAKTVAGL